MKTNEIYLGNAYELIKQLPDKCIDLIVMDPPYKFSSGVGGGAFGSKRRNYHKEYLELFHAETNPDKKEKLRVAACREKAREEIKLLSDGFDLNFFDECLRVLKKTNIYVWTSKGMMIDILNYFNNKNCSIDLIVWCKSNPTPTCNNTYLSDTEYCIFAREKGVKIYGNYNTKKKYYITSTNKKDKKIYGHPTIKPLEIIKNLIINSSSEGDIVLDPFIGTGTTAVAAKELNRNYLGFEINEKYYQTSIDRLNGLIQHKNQTIYQQLSLF